MAPLPLQALCRSRIRKVLRDVIHQEVPSFRVIPLKSKKPKSKTLETYHVRSISIPVGDDESDADDLSLLHDLDRETGSREMNALLNLVLSMERDVDLFYDTDDSVNADVNASENEPSNPDRNTPGEDTDREKYFDCSENVDASPSTSNTNKEIKPTNHPVAETSQSVNKVQNNISSTELIDDENKSSTSKSKDNELLESNDTSQVQNSSSTSSSVNQRRQKFDSGIVDDEYPTVVAENSGSSPDTTTSENLEVTSSEEYLGDNELMKSSDKQDGAKSRRTRRQRKRHYTDEEQDADGEEGDSSEVDSDVSSNVQSNKVKKMKRKSPPPPHPYDVQRQEFSNILKEKINKLPLPLSLKKFVNMNREF